MSGTTGDIVTGYWELLEDQAHWRRSMDIMRTRRSG
jgi:hypothetical protein